MNKALLIGINNYQYARPSLNGCENDVEDVKALLVASGVVADGDVTRLLNEKATRDGIAQAVKALVTGAKTGDHLYVHFSGHGAQLPSSDPQEPDSAEEVLCPYDFNWTADTAIADDEIRTMLSPVPSGAQVTVTVDACHQGDFTRGLRHLGQGTPRTPIVPAAIAAQLASAHGMRGLRSIEAVVGGGFVSACRPWETAADTSFDGRAAGAFTHAFTQAVRATPATSLDEIVDKLGPSLATYAMHPVAEGAESVRSKPYASRATRDLAGSMIIQRPRSLTTIWEDSWSADVFGQRGDVSVAITLSGNDIIAHVRTHLFGTGEWNVVLNGNASVPLDLAFGVQLRLGVQAWSLSGTTLQFQLSIAVSSLFFGSIPIANVPISVRLDGSNRDALFYVPSSAADFVALVNLRANLVDLGRPLTASSPSRFVSRDDTIVPMAIGQESWGPNWREDRAVYPQASPLALGPRAVKRTGVTIDPVKGGGHAEFVRWLTDNERDPSFVMHIGNSFFGGWGSVVYHVEGQYVVDDPFQHGVGG